MNRQTRFAVITLGIVGIGVLCGFIWGYWQSAEQQERVSSRSNGIDLVSWVSESERPTLARFIRDSDAVAVVRILGVKRRGVVKDWDPKTGSFSIDEKSELVDGDTVKLTNQDIRRDNLITEFDAEVVSVMGGNLQPGDRIVLRRPGYAPLQKAGIEANAKSSYPMEVAGDEFLYLLSGSKELVFGSLTRLQIDGQKLRFSWLQHEELTDTDGSSVSLDQFKVMVSENVGKGNPIVLLQSPLPVDDSMKALAAPTARPVAP
jgi:hypothetical protein